MKTTKITHLRSVALAAAIVIQSAIVPAQAASPSELLEKGIYTEETKGDAAGAIGIYQQLVTEAKANQGLAAQAQFRLAQCLLKLNRQHEALAAFEKLIRDFPEETALVAKAREHLPGTVALQPVSWKDGERLQFTLTLSSGMDIGTMELRADLVDVDGRKVWRVGRRMGGGGHMLSSVDVDPETFRPLSSFWKHTALGEVTAIFKAGEVQMKRAGSPDPTTVRADKAVFDNEEVMHMMRRMPLQVGYKTMLPVITTLGGGAVLPIGIEVPKKEIIETPAGKFDCFKLVMDVGQTFWIADDAARYLVKFEGGGAIAHLASVSQRKAGSPVAFHHEASGVSLTAPPEWVIHSTPGKNKTAIHLLDPLAKAETLELSLIRSDSISADAQKSARAWAEHDLRENLGKQVGNLKVRENSWKNHNVAGRLGVSFVADCKVGEKAKVIFIIYAPGPKTSERFAILCAPEEMDALQADLEKIVASYRITK